MIQNRKRKTKDPCPGCRLHKNLCICHLIPRLDLQTKVSLVIHYKEMKRTTNTGLLAIRSLVNGEVFIRGEKNTPPLDLSSVLNEKYRSVLFYPSPEAQELNTNFIQESTKPIQLIVPDGNWRQASKVYSRQTELKNIPKIKISTPNVSTQHLRAEHTPEGMATLEAIAQALGIIEGPWAMEPLLNLYQAKLEKTLIGRGLLLNDKKL